MSSSGNLRALSSIIGGRARRIGDTVRDPLPLSPTEVELVRVEPSAEYDILNKLPNVGKVPDGFSLDTMGMFHSDAQRAGFES